MVACFDGIFDGDVDVENREVAKGCFGEYESEGNIDG